jgi:hypothetical protein
MNQPTLFDAVPAKPIEVGMARSKEAATKWTDEQVRMVDDAIRACHKFQPEFTADDIWRRLPNDFPVTKGLASRLNSFANQGLIMATDRTRKSTRGGEHCHGQRLTIWRSL